ncbi:oligosaccharide flippase family protein [Photobacterium sp. BZF1]|uniref:oligosaccharide flippase family protein n=1 Tax=Photobacterium sp. BZF1 TaxID=1904457 RepID=UPI001653C9C9|nr:oligosaccharide flippase family protein [Photobacterium sp. BZF1]MBC7003564.1 oligosaccharide flippase family protein [Photobacterium sp. BZF1]
MADRLLKKVASGYLWNLLTKWLNRTIGLISTLCLVRLLDPEAFGVAALASIVIAFFSMLSDAGTEKYLIKSKDCTDKMLDSAWSLNIVLKFGCGFVIAILAPSVAKLMNEPVLVDVLLASSLLPLISSFKNIGLVQFERDLDFQPLAKLAISVKMTVVPVTLLLALMLQSYWALVIGVIVSEVLTVLGSYRIHSYRPRWSTALWAEQWGFSKWHLLSVTSGYIRSRIETLMISRFLPSSSVGVYRVSEEFAWLPFTEIIAPATSSLYSGVTKIRDSRKELNDSILKYLAMSYLLVVPSVFGIYTLSEDFTVVVLGERWISAAPILGLLTISMLTMPLNIGLQTVLTNLSKQLYLVAIDIVMICTIVGCLSWVAMNGTMDLEAFTSARIQLVAPFIVIFIAVYKCVLQVSVLRQFTLLIVPMLPAALMVNVLNVIADEFYFGRVINLMILVAAGSMTYIVSMVAVIVLTKKLIPEYGFVYSLIQNATIAMHNKIVR